MRETLITLYHIFPAAGFLHDMHGFAGAVHLLEDDGSILSTRHHPVVPVAAADASHYRTMTLYTTTHEL